jgi:hypothetical protein
MLIQAPWTQSDLAVACNSRDLVWLYCNDYKKDNVDAVSLPVQDAVDIHISSPVKIVKLSKSAGASCFINGYHWRFKCI